MTFKAPLWGNELPGVLRPVATGKPKVDAALTTVMGGDDAPSDIARKAGDAALLAMLDDRALEVGYTFWDDDKVKKLGMADRRAQRKVYDTTGRAVKARLVWLDFLMSAAAASRVGIQRLMAITIDDTCHASARDLAQRALLGEAKLTKEDLTTLAKKLDPTKWDGKARPRDRSELMRVYTFGARARIRLDPKAALKAFRPLLDPSAAAKPAGELRATVVLWALRSEVEYEEVEAEMVRDWVAPIAALIPVRDLSQYALMTLVELPPDPIVIEPTCRAMGKTPADVGYVNDWNVKVLSRAHVASARRWGRRPSPRSKGRRRPAAPHPS